MGRRGERWLRHLANPSTPGGGGGPPSDHGPQTAALHLSHPHQISGKKPSDFDEAETYEPDTTRRVRSKRKAPNPWVSQNDAPREIIREVAPPLPEVRARTFEKRPRGPWTAPQKKRSEYLMANHNPRALHDPTQCPWCWSGY